jgi:HSP20 family molecular chaperone IbpA
MEFMNPQDEGKAIIAPPTEVTDNGGFLCVTCHLHGIPEEEIRIDLEKSQLTLRASKQNETYLRIVTVPEGSRITRKKFHDGILEIILERPS